MVRKQGVLGKNLLNVQGDEDEADTSSCVCALQRWPSRQVKAVTPGFNNIRHSQTCPDSKA